MSNSGLVNPARKCRVGEDHPDFERRTARRLGDRSLDSRHTDAVQLGDLVRIQRRPVYGERGSRPNSSGRSADMNLAEVKAPDRQAMQNGG